MKKNPCRSIQTLFSGYLDGAIRGTQMQAVSAHLERCRDCASEFEAWCTMQRMLSAVGPAKAPAGLDLRLRLALSRERATSTVRRRVDLWQVRWQNAVAPFLVRASAGLASSIVLLGTVAMLIGTMATPEQVAANDATIDTSSAPHFLYSVAGDDVDSAVKGPIVVEASVNNNGRVYDYKVVSGPVTPDVQAQLNNLLLNSVFSPARVFGRPVASRAVLSFTRIAVRG
jgi:anti-sigma factor RsiW